MNRKSALYVFFMLFFFSGSLMAKPSLAVLDSILEEGLDPAIRVPITEKIIEQAVASGEYVVLDRANIAEVLTEKEFQFSGIVKDTEIKKAGEYLGADFVGVARVSKVGETYFISAKIINVETGAIVAQTSAEKKGKADVVFELASKVGIQLFGGEAALSAEEVVVSEEEPVEEEVQPERRLLKSREEKTGPRSHVVVSFLYPIYFGSAIDIIDVQHDIDYFGFDWWTTAYGVDLHFLQVFLKYFYASASLSYIIQTFSSELLVESYNDFDTVDIKAHIGGIFSPFKNFQVYGGVGAGYLMQTLGDYWIAEYSSDSGLAISVEAGADYILMRFISIGLRISTTIVPSLSNWEIFVDNENISYFGIQFGAGLSY